MSAPTTGLSKPFIHAQALVESEDIGANTRVWAFAHVMPGAVLGSDCNIGEHAYIESGVHLGNNVTVKNGVALWSGVNVGDNAFLGPNCVFTNDPNPRAYIKKSHNDLLSTRVGSNATIGANATILCGTEIGDYAFVGAGAVVLHSVPQFGLVVGNPARQIGWMCLCAKKLKLAAAAKPGSKVECRECGAKFVAGAYGLRLAHDAPETLIPAQAINVPFVDLRAQYAQIKDEVRRGIDELLETAHFVGGPPVERFEGSFAEYVGANYAIGVSNGTCALEIALRVLEIGPGDEVIVPANSFFATAEAVSNVGGTPVFADVDPDTYHIDVQSARQVITCHTRAIIPVHLFGRAMDLRPIAALAAEYDLDIIEDAAQAHGSRFDGTPIGGSGRLTCFSFYPGKNLGAYGDAGAITTNNAKHQQRAAMLRDHGSRLKYRHELVGTNARMDALQAAVLSTKLKYLEGWNQARRAHAAAYIRGLSDLPLSLPQMSHEDEHVFHLFVIRTAARNQLRDFLQQRNIATGIHYPVPLHLTPAYQRLGAVQKGALPQAENAADEILSLPMYPELSEEQRNHVISSIEEFAVKKLRAA